ncbi:MAG: hypothetical protein KDD70_15205, partial [Bdellovibrionales bacterium]|nr:hypothetical protein [Bdellovibrionales bacterium]
MRPYILDESRWRALLKEDALSSFGEVDFFDPKVLSNDQLLFATQIMKKPWFELFLFDPSRKSSLQNITKTPLRDEGGVCVSPSKGLFSFRSGNSQEVRSALEPYISYINKGENVPGFIRCIWIDENTFVGVSRAFSLRTAFFKCTATKYRFSCTPLEALKEILHFTSFVRVKNRVGVVGMGTNGGYRRPFLFNEDLSGLLPIDLPRELEGDILDVYSFDGYRVGSQSRYGLFDEKFRSMDSWGTTTLFRALQIGPDIFGIVSSTSHPKHPALLQNGAWVFQGPAKFSLPVDAPSVNEIWIESKDSDLRYQGFLFEGKPTSSLIVWLHGGPKENVSPRYNPYFHALV